MSWMSIVLVGYRGCGKTTIGRRLADRLWQPFADTDEMIWSSDDPYVSAEQTAWYAKEEPTFSDCLRLIRRRIWQTRISPGSTEQADLVQLPRSVVDAVIHGLAAAG